MHGCPTSPRHDLFACFFFFFNDTATTEIYTLSLHDALPISRLGDFMPALKRAIFNLANTYIRRAVPAWRFSAFTMLQTACSRHPSPGYPDAQPASSSPAL